MVGTCSTHGIMESAAQILVGRTKNQFGETGVDGMIMLQRPPN
jgi:hypothetical protein